MFLQFKAKFPLKLIPLNSFIPKSNSTESSAERIKLDNGKTIDTEYASMRVRILWIL